MNIAEIAEYVWINSQVIEFGNSPQWDLELFTKSWSKSQSLTESWKAHGSGLYWFSIKMQYPDLHAVQKPSTLPESGCDIGLLSHANHDLFGSNLLCKHDDDGWLAIYNGHEADITARVRAHFFLNNNKTGALGLKHYQLSNKAWQVRLFSASSFPETLGISERSRIELLMNSPSGRCAVESAWRVKFGWPVLCKQ